MHHDLVCLSHLRWDFVFQRPNHLMTRAARDRRVLFVEEPVFEPDVMPRWSVVDREGVRVATPVLPSDTVATIEEVLERLLDRLLVEHGIRHPVAWFYTPMAVPWTRRLVADAAAVVFDSMDHLAGFRGASPQLIELEAELLAASDVVFTGGASLHRRLRQRHPFVHAFPSSVDVEHFAKARGDVLEPADQSPIPRPRVGYAGVIDERLDLGLIAGVADARPDLQLVLVGPVAKIDPADIPVRPNIHPLGLKPYSELPAYLGGWAAGWMPFARNEATAFISPTKTPEYLAAGLPVVSTSIHDVVDPYGRLGLVSIADDVPGTVAAIEAAIEGCRPDRADVDAFLAASSWDLTWAAMDRLVDAATWAHRARERRHRPRLVPTVLDPTVDPARPLVPTLAASQGAVLDRG